MTDVQTVSAHDLTLALGATLTNALPANSCITRVLHSQNVIWRGALQLLERAQYALSCFGNVRWLFMRKVSAGPALWAFFTCFGSIVNLPSLRWSLVALSCRSHEQKCVDRTLGTPRLNRQHSALSCRPSTEARALSEEAAAATGEAPWFVKFGLAEPL